MDSDEVAEDRPQRRRRRRRHRTEDVAPAVTLPLRTIVRQLAGLSLFGLFFLLIVVAPLPMGGNRDWAWSPLVVVIGVLSLLCAAGIGGREGFKISFAESTPLLALVGCFLFFMLIVLVQMSPFAPLTPSAALYAKAGELLGKAVVPLPTLSVDGTRDALLKCLACAAIFMMARVMFRDQRWGRLLIMMFLLSAAIVVTYALYMSVTTHSCYVGSYLKKMGQYNSATDRCLASGTFVSSNNFGCFCGMAFVATLGLIFDGRRPRRSRHHDEDDEGGSSPIADWVSGRRVILAALALYYLGGLMLSASRGAAGATVIGAIVLGSLLLRGHSRSRRRWAIAGGVMVGGLILVVAGGAILNKFSHLLDSGNINRPVIWRTAIDGLIKSPWIGWGLGSYSDIYTLNQPPTITLPNDKAHSTPLEFLSDMGLIGGLPALAVCLIPWGACLIGALRWRECQIAAIVFSVVAVAILHSLIDFSLQMPAIGFVVSALLGIGWANAFSSGEESQRSFAMDR